MKRKRIEGYEAIRTTQQECTNNQMISNDINKPEIKEGKQNIDDRFPFDTTVDELEKLMKGECQANTAKNTDMAYKTLNHGVLPEISNFPNCDVQTMFLPQKK